MKKYYVEESGQYKIRTTIEAINEEDAIDKLYDKLPNFIDLEAMDYEVNEVKND